MTDKQQNVKIINHNQSVQWQPKISDQILRKNDQPQTSQENPSRKSGGRTTAVLGYLGRLLLRTCGSCAIRLRIRYVNCKHLGLVGHAQDNGWCRKRARIELGRVFMIQDSFRGPKGQKYSIIIASAGLKQC